jgi:hypothetical protein
VIKLSILLVFIVLAGQTLSAQKLLPPESLSKLIPNKIGGFYEDGEMRGSQKAIGDLSYSVCERRFSKGKQRVKILLFDYKDAQIMFKQAMKNGLNNKGLETDSLISRNITAANYTGWETYSRSAASSQIFLGIADRFFLMLSAENVDLNSLQSVLSNFNLESFSKEMDR